MLQSNCVNDIVVQRIIIYFTVFELRDVVNAKKCTLNNNVY